MGKNRKTVNSEADACYADAMFLSLTLQFGSNSIFSEILYSTSVYSKTIFVESLKQIRSLCTEKFSKDSSKSVIFQFVRDKRATDQKRILAHPMLTFA